MTIFPANWHTAFSPKPADPREVRRASKYLRPFLTATYYIYTLSDPLSGVVRYVGCTANPKQRLRSHVYHSNNRRVRRWANGLKSLGLSPVFTIVDAVVGDFKARDAERRLIEAWFSKIGEELFNVRHTKPLNAKHRIKSIFQFVDRPAKAGGK